jgi:hypothetical protein
MGKDGHVQQNQLRNDVFGESNDIGNHWGYCILAVAVPYTTINVVVVADFGPSFDSLHLMLYSMLS